MEDFSIDWTNPMAMFANAPPAAAQSEELEEGEVVLTPTHTHDAQPEKGTTERNLQPSDAAAAARKLENQKRAEMLRAKLVAMRQKTPSKPYRPVSTPAQPTLTRVSIKPSAKLSPMSVSQQAPAGPDEQRRNVQAEPPAPAIDADLEALLAAGKAQADAHMAAADHQQNANRANEDDGRRPKIPRNSDIQDRRRRQAPPILSTVEPAAQQGPSSTIDKSQRSSVTTDLADSYYTDLAAWLEMTGYHDLAYRNSKLRLYKERRALEQEAARIAAKLEKLRRAEQAEMEQLRVGTPDAKLPVQAPPPLPHHLPLDRTHSGYSNGIKRARSPEGTTADKRQRETNGFRVRGTKESPDLRLGNTQRGLHSPSPTFNRRSTYSDARRRSSVDDQSSFGGGSRSRGPSLQERAPYYRRDDEPARYDHYDPRDARTTSGNFRLPRVGRDSGNDITSDYRPSADLDLGKGGVRYFILKSWNHENIEEAQRNNIWATQEKNEEMLTHAFTTARHVVLLFSVNKSTAFQGYALMKSAPDLRIRKPSFTAKLNWATSSAFTLRWLAKAPIHFKMVGHIKNTLNYDEEKGEAHAVMVGKDGQEVNAEAGRGVVQILDDAETDSRSGGGKWL